MSGNTACKKNNLFDFPWVFLCSAPDMDSLPLAGPSEIAFAGRSNAGKSSLINALTDRKSLARTSHRPGCTQNLNYFSPHTLPKNEPKCLLADMPGYGYARAPMHEIKRWTKLVFGYFEGRSTLRRVYVLIDARQGIMKSDEHVFSILDKAAVSYQIVITKADKIKTSDIEALTQNTVEKISKHPAAFPEIILTSSQKGIGIAELGFAIESLISENRE